MMRRITLLLVVMTICLYCGPVHGIEFLTREQFKAETGGYKDYPFRVLFQKLSQSQGDERKKIRTAIIHKQVFDRKMQQRVEAGIVTYERHYGIVRAISEERLRLWDAASQTEKTFQVGLVAVPTLNPDQYPVSRFNITAFAVVAYTLDNRLYQMEIGFPLSSPSDPELRREGSRNRFAWNPPAGVRKPTGYRVFVNDKMFKALEETSVRIPINPEKADEYTVRAVYRHGSLLVESEPSKTIFDSATATELALKTKARQAYDVMLAELNPSRWEIARQMLRENQALFTARLDGPRQDIVLALARFFGDVEEGDRLSRIQPETVAQLEQALGYYEEARRKADALASQVAVGYVADQKISAVLSRTDVVRSRDQAAMTEDTLGRILADLTPASWERARERLYANRDVLTAHLSGGSLRTVSGLLAFFTEIDAGDRFSQMVPATAEQLDRAMGFYENARQKAGTLDDGVSVGFIAELKIGQGQTRSEALQRQSLRDQAYQTYTRILSGLTLTDWPRARQTLYEHREQLLGHLEPAEKSMAQDLLAFFAQIDAGDAMAAIEPATAAHLEKAVRAYAAAVTRGDALGAGVRVGFIAEQKRIRADQKIAALDAAADRQRAMKAYDEILAGLTPAGWVESRQRLDDQRDWLMGHLPENGVRTVRTLNRFFTEIDAGDRLRDMAPETAERLARAMGFYRNASKQAAGMKIPVSVGFVADARVMETEQRLAAIESQSRRGLAQQTYEQVIDNLVPDRWIEARRLLYGNHEMMTAHLPAAQKGTVRGLMDFFAKIDAGDRLVGMVPATAEQLERAMGFYENARQQAVMLGSGAAVDFIAELKIGQGRSRSEALQNQSLRDQARQTYDGILSGLTPADWPRARQALYAHREQLLGYLEPAEKSTVQELMTFFAQIDAGDGLAAIAPATVVNLEKAVQLYAEAATRGNALKGGARVGFVAEQKRIQTAQKIAALDAAAVQQRARKAYDGILAGLTPDDWPEARQKLYEQRDLLLEHLAGTEKNTTRALIQFFTDIDAGDRFSKMAPITLANLEKALDFYSKAKIKGEALADDAPVAFVSEEKRLQVEQRMVAIRSDNQAALAQQTFQGVVYDMTPARWSEGRKRLYAHRDLLETHLDDDRKAQARRLLGLFGDVDRGDRFSEMVPETMKTLEDALAAYKGADAHAGALVNVADLQFLTRPKIEAILGRKTAMEKRQQAGRVEAIYAQILEWLTPGQWASARDLMAEHDTLLKSNLDGAKREALMALGRFFSEIKEGDRLAGTQPSTLANLENAAMFYRSAQAKAAALPGPMDVNFLAAMRLNEIKAQVAAREAYERRLAEEAAVRPSKTVRPSQLRGKEAIKYAMKDFKDGDYSMALQGFSQVYQKQINMMQKGKMSRIQGVMGLPDKYRTEVLFLVELKKLLDKAGTLNAMAMDDTIENLTERMISGRGLWGVIPQDRRDKMADRLENIQFVADDE
jgi:hypothetical protein